MKKLVKILKMLVVLALPLILITSCTDDGTTSVAPTPVPTQGTPSKTPTPTQGTSPIPSTPVESSVHTHSYTETIVKPTCTEDGYTVHTCTCGDSYTDTTVPALGHSYGEWVVTTNPTTTSAGLKERTCTTCNHKDTEEVPAITVTHTHTYGKWQVATNPTETTTGLLVRNCQEDDDSQTKILPALNKEDYKEGGNGVSPTCKTTGIYEYVYEIDGQEFSFKVTLAKLEHELETTTVKPTCTTKGYTKVTCKNCDYEQTTEINALGHDWNYEEATCEHDKHCTVCGTVAQNQLNHSLEEHKTEATCTEDGKIEYVCSICDKKIGEVSIPATGHKYVWDEGVEEASKNESCAILKVYHGECEYCHDTSTRTEVLRYEHDYISEVIKDATCTEHGTIKYTCKDCNHYYEKDYENSSAHNFEVKSTTDGVTLYECSHCHLQKEVISYKDQESASVDTDKLENKEIELKNASIALDKDTLSELPDNITIKAETVEKDDLEIDSEISATIGDNTIYNFGINGEDDNLISNFNGKVTVRVPYELKEGENPDEIAIWYIAQDGSVTAIQAKYSNGYAEFETDHFSYYAVIKLSGKDRCALYGHDYSTVHHYTSCYEDEYDELTCRYCGNIERENVIHHHGHDYVKDEENSTEPTCTENGYVVYICNHESCDKTYTEIIPAKGHNYVLNQDTEIKADCTHSGYAEYECSECHIKYSETTAQTKHNYSDVVVSPTCTEEGYTKHTCKDCGHIAIDSYKSALGHDYEETVVDHTCTEDGYTLHKCSRCNDEYKSNIISASHTWNISEATCSEKKYCTVCNKVEQEATGNHLYNTNGVCINCGHGCDHEYTTKVINATCTTSGYTLKTCSKCGYIEKTDIVKALGHNGNLKCNTCGELVVSDEFINNLLSLNITNNSITFDLSKLEQKFESDSYNYNMTFKDSYITLQLDKNNKLIGYGYILANQEDDDMSYDIEMTLIVKDNILYVNQTQKSNIDPDKYQYGTGNLYTTVTSDTTCYYKYTFDEILVACNLPTSDQIIGMLESYEEVINDVTNVLITMYNTNSSLLRKAAIEAIDKLFTLKKNNTKYTLEFNLNALVDLIDYTKDHSVSELVDYILGEGTYEALEDFAENLNKLQMKDILDLCEYTGLSLSEIFDLLKKYVPNFSDIETSINQLLGNTDSTLLEYLTSTLFRDVYIFDFVKTDLGMDLTSYQINIRETLEQYRNINIIDYILGENANAEAKDQMFKYIHEYIDEYIDDFDLIITTDAIGNIVDIKVLLDTEYSIDDGKIYILEESSISFGDDVVIENDFRSVFDVINDLSFDDIISGLFDKDECEYVYDENNKLVAIKDYDYYHQYIQDGTYAYKIAVENNLYSEEYNKHYNYEFIESYGYVYTYYINELSICEISQCCGNVAEIGFGFSFERIWENKYTFNVYNGVELISTVSCDNIEEEDIYSGIRNKNLYYNTVSKKIVSDGGHNYVCTEIVDPEVNKCCTYGYEKYVCTHCGDVYYEYEFVGHKNCSYSYELVDPNGTCEDGVYVIITCKDCGEIVRKNTLNYHCGDSHVECELVDPNGTCEDGVIVRYICDLCGGVNYEFTSDYHYQIEEKYSLEDYGFEGYIYIYKCACGENHSYYLDNNYDDVKWEELEPETIDGINYEVQTQTYYYKENTFVIKQYYTSYKDGCTIYSANITYLGYKNNNDYLYKIEQNNTSESHNYSTKYETITNDDGTISNIRKDICEDCGCLIRKNVYTYNENEQLISNESYRYNNGEVTYTDICKFIYINGEQLISYSYYMNKDDDYWCKFNYTYDVNNCIRYSEYTNSYGDYRTEVEEYHVHGTYVDATCTQWGYKICDVCHKQVYNDSPSRHCFEYDGNGNYHCRYCGITSNDCENGDLIFEELEVTVDYIKVGFFDSTTELNPIITLQLYVNDEYINLDINVELNYVYNYSGYFYVYLNDILNLYGSEFITNNQIDLIVRGISSESYYQTTIGFEDIFLDYILSQYENISYEYELVNPNGTCADGVIVKVINLDTKEVIREYTVYNGKVGDYELNYGNFQKNLEFSLKKLWI